RCGPAGAAPGQGARGPLPTTGREPAPYAPTAPPRPPGPVPAAARPEGGRPGRSSPPVLADVGGQLVVLPGLVGIERHVAGGLQPRPDRRAYVAQRLLHVSHRDHPR